MTPEKLKKLRADLDALFADAAACEVLLNRVRRFIAEVEATPGMSSDLCWCSGISDDCQRPPSCEWCMLREAASDALRDPDWTTREIALAIDAHAAAKDATIADLREKLRVAGEALNELVAHESSDPDGNHVCWVGESTIIKAKDALRAAGVDIGGKGPKAKPELDALGFDISNKAIGDREHY